MKKCACIFIFVLTMFLIYNIPVCGNPYLDKLDPADDQYVLTPGYLAMDVGGVPFALFFAGSGSYNFNNNIGIKAGAVLEFDQGLSFATSIFGKQGPFYGELGVGMHSCLSIHTGLNGFFPLRGQSGPGFENDLNITNQGLTSEGALKGGWIWLFGKHSRLFIGGQYDYRFDYSNYNGEVIGLVETVVDERTGPWAFDGKAKFVVADDCIALVAHLSTAYMFGNLIGVGVDLNGEYQSNTGLANNVWGIIPGINLMVRH